MSTPPSTARPATACKVLVVDDDRRVRELLEVALANNGFGVITAADGDEALLRAQRERPDLVLLDVRLPKRSGLEVCDLLRNDPIEPGIPIILLSAAADSDHRLQGYLRGADDFLAKPFSPRELIARIRRLLARSAETRTAQGRARDLERELTSVRREARRAGEDARREEMLRDVARGSGAELLRLLDVDALIGRLLEIVHVRLRAAGVAALVVDPARGELAPRAVLGDHYERVANARLTLGGELAALLAGLARPVRRVELDRRDDLGSELVPLLRGRWDLLAPLVSSEGLEAVLLVEESGDPAGWTRAELESLTVLTGVASIAFANARNVRDQAEGLLAVLAEGIYRPVEAVRPLAEAHTLLLRSARALGLPIPERERAAWAVELGEWAVSDEGANALEALSSRDPSGLVAGVRRLAVAAARATQPEEDLCQSPAFVRVALLVCALMEYQKARAHDVSPSQALARAAAWVAAGDAAVAETLAGLEPEAQGAWNEPPQPSTAS